LVPALAFGIVEVANRNTVTTPPPPPIAPSAFAKRTPPPTPVPTNCPSCGTRLKLARTSWNSF